MTRESELISWIMTRVPDAGDDCAVLDGGLLVTVDSVIDGVHARWDVEGPAAFGYKAVARGMSDVAAMGGTPLWAVIATCLPRWSVTDEQAHAILDGAQRTGCRIVGGDTAFGPVPYVVATVIGRAHAKGAVLRSGARVDDEIVVSGPLGGSLQSGRHATFTPRVEEARALVEACDVGAMIDISDGLSTDIHHILDASGVGCRLNVEAIPRNGVSLQEALDDGEDFELLATIRPGATLPAPFVRIGVITDGDAVLINDDGTEEPLVAHGWEHGA